MGIIRSPKCGEVWSNDMGTLMHDYTSHYDHCPNEPIRYQVGNLAVAEAQNLIVHRPQPSKSGRWHNSNDRHRLDSRQLNRHL